MNKKSRRINRLINIVKSKNGASVKELASLLNVSEMTIRRDLALLQADHVINYVYGAAIYNPHYGEEKNDYEVTSAKSKQDLEKNKIGAFAATLIDPDDIVVIDTGSTTEMLAYNIPQQLQATILCYNANILESIRQKENLTLIFSGGRYHPETQMVESNEGISLINSMRFSKAFVSAAGIHKDLGVTCIYPYETSTKKTIMQASLKKILLVDSTKFDQVKSAYFADIEDFDMIITDSSIPDEWIKHIKGKNIELHIVK